MADHSQQPNRHHSFLFRDALSISLMLKSSPREVSREEIEYFRRNPDEIDEISAPVHIHRVFLGLGLILGTALLALSKLLAFGGFGEVVGEGFATFVVDFVFEVGVALIGAAITAYFLGILLNQQQKMAAEWRAEIRNRIDAIEAEDSGEVAGADTME